MKILSKILLYYCLIFSLLFLISTPLPFFLLLLPPALYLAASVIQQVFKTAKVTRLFTARPFLYYSFAVITIVVITGFLGSKSTPEFLSALLFSPLILYFGIRILPQRKQALVIPEVIPQLPPRHLPPKQDFDRQKFDQNRRVFIKLIGSAGVSLFLFSLFTKKAQAAFFGSVPGPGTVAVKDTSGVQIDPAIKQPTDGYKINQLDDSDPAYYGFVNKDGDWFIMKEDSGDYRYYKKKVSDGNFSTEWGNRATLSPYGYFDAIF